MDRTERTCHNDAIGPTDLFENDPPGDHVWCNTVSARVGPRSFPKITDCEKEATPQGHAH
jgi:hypothetical protein